jgi:hypothetical protein
VLFRQPAPVYASAYAHPDWSWWKRQYESRHPKVCVSCYATPHDRSIELHHLEYDERYPQSDVRRLLVDDDSLVWLCDVEHDEVTRLHTGTGMNHREATDYYLATSDVERWRVRGASVWRGGFGRLAAWLAVSVALAVPLWMAVLWFGRRVDGLAHLLDPTQYAERFGACVVASAITLACWRFTLFRWMAYFVAVVAFIAWRVVA